MEKPKGIIGKVTCQMAPKETEVPPARVKRYYDDDREPELGTVTDQTGSSYVIIPDYNMALTEYWPKTECDVIK